MTTNLVQRRGLISEPAELGDILVLVSVEALFRRFEKLLFWRISKNSRENIDG